MEEKEKTFKEEALGSLDLKKKKATNDFKPDKEKLRAPLSEGAGLRRFCCGCGSYNEIPAELIQEYLAAMAALKYDYILSPDDHYYETTKCIYCDSKIEKAAFKYIEDGSVYIKMK